jgi:hypothetical protein
MGKTAPLLQFNGWFRFAFLEYNNNPRSLSAVSRYKAVADRVGGGSSRLMLTIPLRSR